MNVSEMNEATTPMAAAVSPKGDPMAHSKLVARGGFQVFPQLFSKHSFMAMFGEACQCFADVTEERREGEDHEDWRGGLPPRKLLAAGGGGVQDSLYTAPALSCLLSELIGTPVRPSGNRASYSYYCRACDHLALHRDVSQCDVSVIAVISDNTGANQGGGELVVYPDRMQEPLSHIRINPEHGAVRLKLVAGETVILAGGILPHLVTPVADGQYRIVAPMCFEALT